MRRRLGIWIVAVVAACGAPSKQTVVPGNTPGASDAVTVAQGATRSSSMPGMEQPISLDFTLRAGQASAPTPERVRNVPGTPTSDAEADALLKTLPALPKDSALDTSFSKRAGSAPPPTAVVEIKDVFGALPADGKRPKPAKVPVEVVRVSPQGDVSFAPELTVTFNQPMIALSSHADSATQVPVKLSPLPKGRFRWLGTRTVVFTPEGRFPMATEYSVEIPAGTRAVDGSALAKGVVQRFKTPAPTLQEIFPTDDLRTPTSLSPVVFARFDQAINKVQLIAQTRFCQAKRCIAAREATATEIAAAPEAQAAWERSKQEGVEARTVGLIPVEALPPDAKIELQLGRVPSAEGPLLGKSVSSHLRTRGPFKILGSKCGYDRCTPYDGWIIELTNPVDAASLDLSAFKVEPQARLTAVSPSWSERGMTDIVLSVEARARTKYTLTVPAGVRDVFGQTLQKAQSFEFQVGDPPSALDETDALTVLDPRGPRALSVRSTGVDRLKVKVYRVTPEQWHAYTALQRLERKDQPAKIPGKRVVDTVIKVSDPSIAAATLIDVSAALDSGLGHAIVLVEPDKWHDSYVPRVLTWIESTQLSVDGFFDRDNAYAWVTSLADGKPRAGAAVSLWPDRLDVKADEHGLAKLVLPDSGGQRSRLLVAKVGSDVAFYPEAFYEGEESNWRKQPEPPEQTRWFVFDDRGAYRPSETVHVKGWLRATRGGDGGKLVVPTGVTKVNYQVTSSRGHSLAQGSAKVTSLGGFDLSFVLPSEVDLGYANIQLTAEGKTGGETSHSVRVEEFRRPEYEVSVAARDSLHFAGDVLKVDAKASYYTGGPLAGAATVFTVTAQRSSFTPPNRADYTFGEPPRWFEPWMHSSRFGMHQGPTRSVMFNSKTDGSGVAALEIASKLDTPAYAHNVTVTASVEDVNRQAWTDQTELLVHPSNAYVGLKSERWFVAQGEPLAINTVVVDLDGKDVVGRPVEVRASRFETETSKGESVEKELDVQLCQFNSDGAAHVCTFKPKGSGQYRIAARVLDDKGRASDSQMTAWVSGPTTGPAFNVSGQQVQLIPNKVEYRAGDVAEVMVQVPFSPAEAVVRHTRDGIQHIEHVHIAGTTHLLKIPVTDAQAPSLHVEVSVVGSRPLESQPDQRIPAFAEGNVDLKISLGSRALKVEVKPLASVIEPGARTGIDITLRAADGSLMPQAEVAVAVVDEAVLALTGYAPADPLTLFYPDVAGNAWNVALRPYVRVEERKAFSAVRDAAAGGAMLESAATPSAAPVAQRGAADKSRRMGASSMSQGPAPTLRKEFSPIALFAPALVTNDQGVAHVDFAVPDDLTRYRVFALAVQGAERFGKGESTITARKLLMVRPSAPRFLNFGDRFELPIVLENQGDAPLSVLLAARASNVLFTAGRGRRVEVPAHDRIEVRYPMTTRSPGMAQIQVAAQAAKASDAAQAELPVWTPATDEAFATYGSIATDQATAQPIAIPRDAFVEFGGLEISTSSTQIAALTDSVLYMVDYPFECSEQLASRVLTLIALRDVLAAFKVEGIPSADEAQSIIQTESRRLVDMQNPDGGFPYWKRGEETIPFNTEHALHALIRARKLGISGLDEAIERARAILPQLAASYAQQPALQRSIRAYGLYLEGLLGSDVRDQVASLWQESKPADMPIEAIGWMLGAVSTQEPRGAIAQALVGALQNRANETASTAQFTESYTDTKHVLLHSNQRSDAIALEGLMRSHPDHDLAAKVAKGLLAHRSRGRWGNTQENVFAAIALRAYFDHYERETPSFEARAFVGSILAQAAPFKGRSTEQHTTSVPMKWLSTHSASPVVMQRVGQGRMYYRLGLRYAPKQLDLQPEDQGFEVSRSYEGIDNASDVVRNDDGSWTIRAGARVRVNVEMVTKARRYHVALVDPLAAGLEAIQTSLKVNAQPPSDLTPSCPMCKQIWWGSWYEHDNLRDERAEAFSSLVDAGVYTYSYLARATTPGQFVVPPAKAEEMYMPETFGRSSSDRIVVR